MTGSPAGSDRLAKRVCVVGLVGDHILALEASDQGLGLSDVVTLPSSEREAERVAEGIDGHVHFGAESTFAASQRLCRVTPARLARSSGTGMSPNDRAINEQMLHIWVVYEMLMHLLPDSVVTPAGRPLVDAFPCAIRVWQQSPLGATTGNPQHAFDKAATGGFLPDIDIGPGT